MVECHWKDELTMAESYPRRVGVHTLEVVGAEQITARAADVFAAAVRSAVDLHGTCVLALSGGSTPAAVFAELATRDLPWEQVVITQVDERVAPAGDPDRNLTGQQAAFEGLPVRWMPLRVEGSLAESLGDLVEVAGDPPILDVVHLGLGSDGHTASLVPGDPVLDVIDQEIAITEEYQGRQRMTFTRASLNRSRLVVWLVVGADKADALAALARNDQSIPASLLELPNSLILADPAAASALAEADHQ